MFHFPDFFQFLKKRKDKKRVENKRQEKRRKKEKKRKEKNRKEKKRKETKRKESSNFKPHIFFRDLLSLPSKRGFLIIIILNLIPAKNIKIGKTKKYRISANDKFYQERILVLLDYIITSKLQNIKHEFYYICVFKHQHKYWHYYYLVGSGRG